MFNNRTNIDSFLADAVYGGSKKMTISVQKILAFIEEPATYHFLLALIILLVGFANPSIAKEMYAVAGFFGLTGIITYNQ